MKPPEFPTIKMPDLYEMKKERYPDIPMPEPGATPSQQEERRSEQKEEGEEHSEQQQATQQDEPPPVIFEEIKPEDNINVPTPEEDEKEEKEIKNPMDAIPHIPKKKKDPQPKFAGRYPSRTRNTPIELSQDKYGRLMKQFMLKAQAEALAPRTPRGFNQASKGQDGPRWMTSMEKEYNTHVKNGTFGGLFSKQEVEDRRRTSNCGEVIGEVVGAGGRFATV